LAEIKPERMGFKPTVEPAERGEWGIMPADISRACKICHTNYIGEVTIGGVFWAKDEVCNHCRIMNPRIWVIHNEKLLGVEKPEKRHFRPETRIEVGKALARGDRVFVTRGLQDDVFFWNSPQYGMSWDQFFQRFDCDWEWWPEDQ
jgi:hypothetical protein